MEQSIINDWTVARADYETVIANLKDLHKKLAIAYVDMQRNRDLWENIATGLYTDNMDKIHGPWVLAYEQAVRGE